MIDRLCIIGVGLIGGSVACAARSAGLCGTVVGVDRDRSNLAKAIELGVVDEASERIQDGAADADLVLVATPVGASRAIFNALQPVWSDSTVYTDVGSTKANVLEALHEVFGAIPTRFIGGHPIAGAESSGVGAAEAGLFRRRRVILTPVEDSDPAAVDTVRHLWEAIGANVSLMTPAHHDEILAATSHLPHVLAFTLVNLLGRMDERREIFQFAAGGFRDFSRIASSDPTMWRDICLANRAALLPLLKALHLELDTVSSLIEQSSEAALLEYFQSAKDARQRFLNLSEKPS